MGELIFVLSIGAIGAYCGARFAKWVKANQRHRPNDIDRNRSDE